MFLIIILTVNESFLCICGTTRLGYSMIDLTGAVHKLLLIHFIIDIHNKLVHSKL